MRIAICDDNSDFDYNTKMEHLLNNYIMSRHNVDFKITSYISGQDLAEKYEYGLYNYIFIDVDMPELDGFETVKKIRQKDRRVGIVFVTNMEERVYESFQFGAKDYLLKPVEQKKIDELMDRLILERSYHGEGNIYRINIKFGGVMELYLSDVLYFESDNKYVIAATVDENHRFSSSLERVADDLKRKGFVRISKNRVVNTTCIFQIFGSYIALKNGEKLNIGRKYRAEVNAVLKKSGSL